MNKTEIMASQAEPYEDESGCIGFAIIERGGVVCRTLEEWAQEDHELSKILRKQAEAMQGLFQLPPAPDMDAPLEGLQTEVMRFISRHVWFVDERCYEGLANWALATWVQDLLTHAPRVVFFGPPKSGKSRALRTLAAVTYRTFSGAPPSGPSLFRLIELHRTTIILDEYQTLINDRKNDIDAVLRTGYEKDTPYLRCGDNLELQKFDAYAPIALGSKLRLPPDDILSRSIIVNMMQKDRDAQIARSIDMEQASRLRGQLLAFRLKAMVGEIDILALLTRALEIAEAPVQLDGKEALLDDRSIDKARTLLVPGVYFKAYDDTLSLLGQSELDANDEMRETLEGKAFYALQAEFEQRKRSSLDEAIAPDVTRISATDITEQLNADLKFSGDAGKDELKTRTVAKALRALGFRFAPGSANRSYLVKDGFELAYRTGIRKYGNRPRSESPSNPYVTASNSMLAGENS